ncbi:hypothetical protein AB5I41_24960 [Sphingomonas sp. MMS24-JH45]
MNVTFEGEPLQRDLRRPGECGAGLRQRRRGGAGRFPGGRAGRRDRGGAAVDLGC